MKLFLIEKSMQLRIKFLIMLNILLLKILLMTAKFAARLKQANLVSKTDVDNKIICFNRKIASKPNI